MARRQTIRFESGTKSPADKQLPLVSASDSESYSETESLNPPKKASIRDPATLGQLQELHLDPSLDPRRRRPSEDIARDALVEQILTENRTEHYDDGGTTVPKTSQAGRNEDADERLAAQFRQDFLDSQAQRLQQQQQQQQRNKAAPKDPGQSVPKLGGSRSQRAAMEKARREKEMKDNPGK